MAKIKIAIDAGHGSNTSGKRTPPFTKAVDVNYDGKIDVKKGEQYREHYANAGVANLLAKALTTRGYVIVKTGWDDANTKDDPDTALSLRQQTIKKAACDYSISIHFNANGDGKTFNSAKGVGVYYHSQFPGDSKKLATYVLNELAKGYTQPNRGVHTDDLAMCNCRTMNTKASILCELAFMTNSQEAMNLMANNKFWAESANQIADGLDKYIKSLKK